MRSRNKLRRYGISARIGSGAIYRAININEYPHRLNTLQAIIFTIPSANTAIPEWLTGRKLDV